MTRLYDSAAIYNLPLDGAAWAQLEILAAEVGISPSEAAGRSIRLALRMRSLTMAMHGIVAPLPQDAA